MTVVAVGVSLLVGAVAVWWVWSTPGRPTSRKGVPVWGRACAARSLAATIACVFIAAPLDNLAPSAGAWPWAGAIVMAVAAVGFTVAAFVTDSTRRVPTILYPLGWAVAAVATGAYVIVNTAPTVGQPGAVDTAPVFAAGQRAALLVGAVGVAHTWWVWRRRRKQRDRIAARRQSQVTAMRAQIDREQKVKTTMRGRRAR